MSSLVNTHTKKSNLSKHKEKKNRQRLGKTRCIEHVEEIGNNESR